MKLITQLFVAAVLAAFAISAQAQGKIAVLDPQTAILNTQAAKEQLDKLKNKPDFAKTQKQFEGLRADLQGLAQDQQKNGMTWSDEKKSEHQKRMEYLRADLELAARKLKSEQDAALQRIMQEMAPKAEQAVKELIEAEGLGLVLTRNVVVHANPSYDITAKLTEKLNQMR